MSDTLFFNFNGVNGSTGEYEHAPMSLGEIAALARSETWDAEHLEELRELYLRTSKSGTLAPRDNVVVVTDLAQTGWGVIFARDTDPAVKEALEPLLKHRKSAATKYDDYLYREFFEEGMAYLPPQSKAEFLHAWEANETGPVDPKIMPYYLLLVGSPEQIPYKFQYELDVEYAVGRIHFNTVEEYAHYAQTVVDAENGKMAPRRNAVFFGTRHENDRWTNYCADHLVVPLAKGIKHQYPDWSVQSILASEATKSRLGQLLGGKETPSLLFTATHGVGFENEDPRKLTHQGALLCQNWPGRKHWDMPPDFYFSADDVKGEAQLGGLLSFHVACYSAGSPGVDDFPELKGKPSRLTFSNPGHHPFLAALPMRLLGHPNGGALAVIGHVEQIWSYSFMSTDHTRSQLLVFEETLGRLLRGYPVGFAMEFFNHRYAEQTTMLSNLQEELRRGKQIDDSKLGERWMASNDARNYIVLGDPAVRLNVSPS